MRARNLKPSTFKNELLATSDPLYAWVFEGLWCLADREGRLEDRPRRIHLEVNAGRAYEGTEASLNWLAENGFITRYTAQQTAYIQVVNFKKHQNPHVREPASAIPAPDSSGSSPMQGDAEHKAGPSLSPFPLPDSPSLIPDSSAKSAPRANAEPDWWIEFRSIYPRRAGDQDWREGRRAANARIAEGHAPVEFVDGARRYAAFCEASGSIGTQYVKQASTFLGKSKAFLEPWTPPPSKSQLKQDKNLTASQIWLQQQEAGDATN